MKTTNLLVVALLCAAPLGILGAPATDRQIEEAARSSYNFRKVLDRSVDIKVYNGVATLTGMVVSDEQRRIAEDTVAGLDGVIRVDNQLRVEGAREGSDDWIALKVRSRLAVRPNVSMKSTNVAVKDGVVTLTGTAESMAQKELTEAYAKDIAGVRAVENKLHVVEPADRVRVESSNATAGRRDVTTSSRAPADNRLDDRDTLGEKIDDGSITAQIKYELFAHRSTSGLKTKVDTKRGHVLITGEAGSEAERDLVTKLARSVRGVLSVDNNMTVKNR